MAVVGEQDAGSTRARQTYAVEVQPGAAWAPLRGGYRRRDPEATVLYQAVRENLATFLRESAEHGGLPRHVEQELFDYLGCGVLSRGFSRVQCQACGDELLVAFSCKRRGVCPSCNARRAHNTAIRIRRSSVLMPPIAWSAFSGLVPM